MANYTEYSEASRKMPPGVTYESDPTTGSRYIANWIEKTEEGLRPRRLAFSVLIWGEEVAFKRACELAEKQRRLAPSFYEGRKLPPGFRLIERENDTPRLRVRRKGGSRCYDVNKLGIDEAIRRGHNYQAARA